MKMARVKYRIDRLLLIGMLISITAYICSGEMISGSYFGLLLMICCFLIGKQTVCHAVFDEALVSSEKLPITMAMYCL